MVHMKALQDRCAAEERVIHHLRKCNDTLINEQALYKEALRTLNKEVVNLKRKVTEVANLKEKANEAKANLEKELTTLYE